LNGRRFGLVRATKLSSFDLPDVHSIRLSSYPTLLGRHAMLQTSVLSEKAARILAQFPGPVTLSPSKIKATLVLLLAIPLIALGVVGIRSAALPNDWFFLLISILIVAAFGLGSIVYLASLATGAGRMVLDAEGFGFPSAWRTRKRLSWKTTSGFAAIIIGKNPCVSYIDDNRGPGLFRSANRFFGGDALLPDTYGLGAVNLARLMSAWREHALAVQDDSKTDPHGSSSVSQ
jgi:hypothetical protein